MLLGVAIVIAAVALVFLKADRPTEEAAEVAAVGETSRTVPQRETPRRSSRATLQPADVVKMTPEDWSERFRKYPSEVSAEYEQEILSLAEELAEILRQNPDPNGVEASVFTDAILTLLAEGRRPE